MKGINQFFVAIILVLNLGPIAAQPDIHYLDKTGILKFGGGNLVPNEDFAKNTGTGLLAMPGHQVNFAFNYIIRYGLGLGAHLDVNRLPLNEQRFVQQSSASAYRIQGKFGSTRFGLNLVGSVPIVIHPQYFAVNLFGEFQLGLRGMNIPSIDLRYNELENNYVEVSYRPRSNTMGYLAANAGVQFLFANKFGIYGAYHITLRSRHSIKYSVRAFDAERRLTEYENYLHNYLNVSGFQFGAFFLFGKN
jgi:hypothetical protein